MHISGIQQLSVMDYPGKLSCIIFTAGCNFRCGFCHNPEFVNPAEVKRLAPHRIREEVVWSFLEKRKGLLDAVVISGGEPTLMPDLLRFMKKVKAYGYLVKLDTNGARPQVVRKAIDAGLVDYIAMDMKYPFARYQELVGTVVKEELLRASANMIMQSGIPYEFRSTLIQQYHSKDQLTQMAKDIAGAKQVFLQTFRPEYTLDPQFRLYSGLTEAQKQEAKKIFMPFVEKVVVR